MLPLLAGGEGGGGGGGGGGVVTLYWAKSLTISRWFPEYAAESAVD